MRSKLKKSEKLEIINELMQKEFIIEKHNGELSLSCGDDNEIYTYMGDLGIDYLSSDNHVSVIDETETENAFSISYEVEDNETGSAIVLTLEFNILVGKQTPRKVNIE